MASMHESALAGLHLSRALLRQLVATKKMTKADASAVWDEAIKTCLAEGPSQDRQNATELMKRFRAVDLA
jgi:hypothetical protein